MEDNMNNTPIEETTPGQVSDQHVDSKAETNSPAPEQQEENKRELNKMSQLEKERNELKKKAEESESRLKTLSNDLNSTFKQSPEAYEAFRENYNKLNPNAPLKSYEETYGERPGTQMSQQTSAQKAGNPEEIVNLAVKKIKEEQQNEAAQTAFNSFIAKHEEFKPDSATQESKDLLMKVTAMADVYVTTYGMTPDAALEEAYKSVPENRGKIERQAQEDGETIGQARVLSKGAGETAPGGTGTSNIPKSDRRSSLNQSQQVRYDELYLKNPRVAELYLNNLLK